MGSLWVRHQDRQSQKGNQPADGSKQVQVPRGIVMQDGMRLKRHWWWVIDQRHGRRDDIPVHNACTGGCFQYQQLLVKSICV
jgi:hypothetical protein